MAGVKGRSGGKRYAKSNDEKKLTDVHCRLSAGTITKMQQIAVSKYGSDQYMITRVLEDAVNNLYEQTILAKIPPYAKQGSYVEFREDFMNIYRPDINNPVLERDYYVSSDLVMYLRKYADDKKHQGVIVHRIVTTFVDDLQNIYEYYLRKKIYYDFPQIAAYALKYFAEPTIAI